MSPRIGRVARRQGWIIHRRATTCSHRGLRSQLSSLAWVEPTTSSLVPRPSIARTRVSAAAPAGVIQFRPKWSSLNCRVVACSGRSLCMSRRPVRFAHHRWARSPKGRPGWTSLLIAFSTSFSKSIPPWACCTISSRFIYRRSFMPFRRSFPCISLPISRR
jgi:hypothetical protein